MFKLLRHFSLTSAVAILSVTVVLVILFRQTAVNELVELAENHNVVSAPEEHASGAFLFGWERPESG